MGYIFDSGSYSSTSWVMFSRAGSGIGPLKSFLAMFNIWRNTIFLIWRYGKDPLNLLPLRSLLKCQFISSNDHGLCGGNNWDENSQIMVWHTTVAASLQCQERRVLVPRKWELPFNRIVMNIPGTGSAAEQLLGFASATCNCDSISVSGLVMYILHNIYAIQMQWKSLNV